jgi:hypothetical protein
MRVVASLYLCLLYGFTFNGVLKFVATDNDVDEADAGA